MKFERIKLRNGLRIVLCRIPGMKSVTSTILFGVGSRYETKQIGGISHFLEHMMFKGTTRRPSTLDIARELDGVGADYNASTGKEITSYYIKLANKHIDRALDIQHDMLQNSIFSPHEISREKNVVIEEINMYEDKPNITVEEILEQKMFGSVPLGWNIAGTKGSVRAINRDKVRKYFNAHYNPNNMVIGVVGGFDRNHVLGSLKKYFQSIPRKSVPSPKKAGKIKPGPRFTLKYKKTEQAHLCFGFEAFPYNHKDLPILSVLNTVFGANMSSRLFISIRERQGLAYGVRSDITKYSDCGLLTIYAGVDTSRLSEAIKGIIDEIELFKQKGVTTEELQNAKEFIKGKVALGLEESESISAYLLEQEYFNNKILTPEQRFKIIDRVTQKDIQRVAQLVLQKKKMTLALIGPYRNKQTIQRLI